jgi:RNA 2',3'-cyclic 3'-phosphodiesterase
MDEPGRRLFVAVPLPTEATDALVGVVDEIRALAIQGRGRDVRWVRMDGLHLTLRFLGPTMEDRVAPTVEAVRAAATSIRPFEIVLGRAGAFPSEARPRAIWVDVIGGAEQLGIAASIVDASLATAGWDIEERPFRPHLTLARSDGVRAGSAVAATLIERARDLRISCAVDRIGLFESLTGGGPARYEPLELARLG